MRRIPPEVLGFALLASCATYEELGQLQPDGPGPTSSGASGMAASAGSLASGGGGAGSGAPSGGSATASGGSAGSGAVSGASIGGTSAGAGGSGGASGSGAGQGGMPADACPDDPAKTAPGTCGCGFPEADTAELAGCAGLKSALAHRYDFEGEGEAVLDRVGTLHGAVQGGGMLSRAAGKGVLELSGGTNGTFVDLPNGSISSFSSATLEVWVTWAGGSAWQRIFDFGDSTAAEDSPAEGESYLFLTPTTGPGGTLRAVYSLDGGAAAAETRVSGATALPQALTQAVVVVDSEAQTLSVFVDGELAGEQPFTGSLEDINDVNCWLGRSQYLADPGLSGTLHDFRIYSAALSPLQIATSFAGGPDPAFLTE